MIMSRSAADATRFTATGPYAKSKPSSSVPYKLPDSLLNGQNNRQHPPEEPPSQDHNHQESARAKVERLRAQARAARLAHSSSRIDRFISAGRVLADKAHKVTVYSLLAASGEFFSVIIYILASC